MPLYKYTAKDYSLNRTTGEINAVSEKEARSMLKMQDLFVLEIKVVKEKKEKGKGGLNMEIELFDAKVKHDELTLFSRQFATLIESGVPISRSLHILSMNTDNKTLQRTLSTVTDDIENGSSLSVALSKHKKIFPPLYIDMVAAAEIGGALPEVLDRLATYMEKDKSVRGKVKSAFTYPTIVMLVAIIAVVVILSVVIPKFVPLFEDLGAELPLPTRILMSSSTFLQSYWYIALMAVAAFGVGVFLYSKTKVGREHIDWLKLNIPIIGVVVQKSSIARFARTLETLQRSGVPLVESLSIVGKTSGNVHIERAIQHALNSLEEGQGIAKPLATTNIFPPLVTQMMEIGEETGELERLLSKVADFYEEEVDVAVKNLTSMIEPIITVFLGVVVGFIAIAVIMPMYEMMGEMQNQM